MQYTSTRDTKIRVSAAKAILSGIAPDGGLYVPVEFPNINVQDFYGLTYPQTAHKVLSLFLTDYDSAFLEKAIQDTYCDAKFAGKAGYVQAITQECFSLELWHGPTCAFKDYALQLMPKLLVEAKRILNEESVTKILVATSGDTGTAALAGYAGLPDIKIAVFYPDHGTSEIQRLQMATQEGENVAVYAIKGNFDDAQTGVKQVFADQTLAQNGEQLSSANSINWGRLVPQIVYYFYSYAQLVAQKKIADGTVIDFCVPTGNFGDILAGYYAKQMGLPIGKLVCASNNNNVLTDFLSSGIYDARRCFYRTTSPSMDILVSSNLERLLYHSTKDSKQVATWMQQLSKEGIYTVNEQVLTKIQKTFGCGFAGDVQSAEEIKMCYVQHQYLLDPHTAVAWHVAKSEKREGVPCVVVSTANPYKFSGAVLSALGYHMPQDEFDAVQLLQEKTNLKAPEALLKLKQKTVRFTQVIEKDEISTVTKAL